jgi:hypothetical protein
MTRATKSEARQAVSVYGDLLRERAVISEITTEEERGEMTYKLRVEGKFPTEIACRGIKEAALVLSSMWFAYSSAKEFLGYDDQEEWEKEFIYD